MARRGGSQNGQFSTENSQSTSSESKVALLPHQAVEELKRDTLETFRVPGAKLKALVREGCFVGAARDRPVVDRRAQVSSAVHSSQPVCVNGGGVDREPEESRDGRQRRGSAESDAEARSNVHGAHFQCISGDIPLARFDHFRRHARPDSCETSVFRCQERYGRHPSNGVGSGGGVVKVARLQAVGVVGVSPIREESAQVHTASDRVFRAS
eukprot:scaffold825_cov249-Pinguiococcus_pyrenoidosus.AAC.20